MAPFLQNPCFSIEKTMGLRMDLKNIYPPIPLYASSSGQLLAGWRNKVIYVSPLGRAFVFRKSQSLIGMCFRGTHDLNLKRRIANGSYSKSKQNLGAKTAAKNVTQPDVKGLKQENQGNGRVLRKWEAMKHQQQKKYILFWTNEGKKSVFWNDANSQCNTV